MGSYHKYNKETVTSCKKAVTQWFKFSITGGAGAVNVLSQGKSNFVASVARTSQGVYTVTLTSPFPPVGILYCDAVYSRPAVGTPERIVNYQAGSYNATTGTFIINVTDSQAVPVVADPIASSEIMVEVVYQWLKKLTD